MARSIFAISGNQEGLHDIISRLERNGFRRSDLSVVFPSQRSTSHVALPEDVHAAAREVESIAQLSGVGEVAVPGLGALMTTGPMLAPLCGIAVKHDHNLVGSLIAAGIPERHARQYDAQLIAGCILVAIHVDDIEWARKATKVLQDAGACEMSLSNEQPSTDWHSQC